jgi:hypothetical protein
VQIVQCVYREQPNLDVKKILARAQQILGTRLESNDATNDSKAILILHPETLVTFSDATGPAQTLIASAEDPESESDWESEIQQSWSCPNAAELLQGCRITKLVAEMLTRTLDPPVRVKLFHGVLQAMVEVTRPVALVFKHSQQVVDPSRYLKSCDKDPFLRPGSLNVRFFNISNSGGDMIMDTRGMEEIGLHDLQCHYRDLEPNAVSRILYDTAYYVYENGPVIESGNTIAGIEPDSKWRCQFEESMLKPQREILDVNPGAPYAAGNRAAEEAEE